jgi:hypothetical protein
MDEVKPIASNPLIIHGIGREALADAPSYSPDRI